MESSKSENMYVTSLSEGSLPPLKKQERIRAPHKKTKKYPYTHKILTERVQGVKNVSPLSAIFNSIYAKIALEPSNSKATTCCAVRKFSRRYFFFL